MVEATSPRQAMPCEEMAVHLLFAVLPRPVSQDEPPGLITESLGDPALLARCGVPLTGFPGANGCATRREAIPLSFRSTCRRASLNCSPRCSRCVSMGERAPAAWAGAVTPARRGKPARRSSDPVVRAARRPRHALSKGRTLDSRWRRSGEGKSSGRPVSGARRGACARRSACSCAPTNARRTTLRCGTRARLPGAATSMPHGRTVARCRWKGRWNMRAARPDSSRSAAPRSPRPRSPAGRVITGMRSARISSVRAGVTPYSLPERRLRCRPSSARGSRRKAARPQGRIDQHRPRCSARQAGSRGGRSARPVRRGVA